MTRVIVLSNNKAITGIFFKSNSTLLEDKMQEEHFDLQLDAAADRSSIKNYSYCKKKGYKLSAEGNSHQ